MSLISRSLGVALSVFCISQPVLAALDEMGIDLDAAYSATRVIESAGSRLELRENRAPGRYRMEFDAAGETLIYVMREAENEAYMLLPSVRIAMAVPSLQVRELSADVNVLEREEMGRETINGHEATRYRGKFRDPRGGVGEGYYWVTDEGIPVRIDMTYEDADVGSVKVLMELQDLQVGAQDPALFAVPDDYQTMSGMGGFPAR